MKVVVIEVEIALEEEDIINMIQNLEAFLEMLQEIVK